MMEIRCRIEGMDVGERLRQQRLAVGLSLGQVAAYEDVSKSYLSALETGANAPNVWPLLARLAKRYETSADYLLGLTDDPRPHNSKPLPAGGVEMAQLLSALSDRGRAELLAVAQALSEQDAQWQESERAEWMAQGILGLEELESVQTRLVALGRKLGSRQAAIDQLARLLDAELLSNQEVQ